jgi:hypothetical protein
MYTQYHLNCITPPLESIPIDDWFCHYCISDRFRADVRVDGTIIENTVRS